MKFSKAVISFLLTSLLPAVAPAHNSGQSAYDFTLTTIDGETLPLSRYKGKALLIVNTASQCGFTGQYNGLQQLWEKYRDRELVIIAVPSNDFAEQEPGNAVAIKEFCQINYKVTFPIMEKQHVAGPQAHPLFGWLEKTLGKSSVPKWNFYKYLINAEGQPVNWFISTTNPVSDRMVQAIEENLPPRRSEK
jgi:glutathione peroxidase